MMMTPLRWNHRSLLNNKKKALFSNRQLSFQTTSPSPSRFFSSIKWLLPATLPLRLTNRTYLSSPNNLIIQNILMRNKNGNNLRRRASS